MLPRNLGRVLPVLYAGFALASAVFSQTLPNGVQKLTSIEGISEYAFPNGLHVLLFPDSSKPRVTVNMTYEVGSRNEGNGEAGMAHLMEHMLFLRTSSGRDIKKELTDHGADWNGTTSYDRTNYFETVTASADNLHWAIGLEADRMVKMRIEKGLLDAEMTVVRNEFENGDNNPYGVLRQRMLGAAYSFHNYGRAVIGTRSDIENVPIERLAAFYQKYYQPDDAVLTIAGQFDPADALATAATSFGAIPKPQRVLEKVYTVEPPQEGERMVTLRRIGDDQMVSVVYHVPAAAHPDTAALSVLTTILGDNPSGRLYHALVYDNKAVSAGMGNNEMHDPGFAFANARLRKDQSIDEAREILLKTIESFSAEPASKEELDRAKNRLLKDFELEMTDSQDIGLTLSQYIAQGDWRLLFLSRDRIKAVTADDVARVAKAYLRPENRTVGEFIPSQTPVRAEIPSAPDTAAILKDFKGSEAVTEGEAFVPTPANIEARVKRSKLAEGPRLALLPVTTRGGAVVARLRLDFGDEKSMFGQSTVAQLTGQMLMRGTKNKTRQQIQDEMDRLKTYINLRSGPGVTVATIETKEAALLEALRLAVEILREPSFPASEFEQLKQQQIAGRESQRSQPATLANQELQRRLNPFPRGDVHYVATLDEQIQEIRGTTLDQIKAFHAQFYGASNAKLILNGQSDTAQIGKLAQELLAGWKSPSPYNIIMSPYARPEPGNQKIETPGKSNANWLAGENVRMNQGDADYPAMVIANYIFGGSGGSRLFKRVRDKEGLSYGVGSGFNATADGDLASFRLNAISAPQNTPKVEASIKDELARTLKDGFKAEEVASAKKSWLEEAAITRADPTSLLGQLMFGEFHDRTMKWFQDLEDRIAVLTPQQVSEAFRRHIDVNALFIVKAGDFKAAGAFQ